MKLLAPEKRILLKHIDDPNLRTLAGYEKHGGYQALKKALEMAPEAIIDEVKKSGLKGRGGAGFPTRSKCSFVPVKSGKPVYLLCNADESEPGTFKDRVIMEKNPHSLIEGILIAGIATRSHKSYIYIRGEYTYAAKVLEQAVQEAYDKKYLGKSVMGSKYSMDLVVHRGAGAYICGEETGLISSLEGKKGQPKLKPPFPAVSGFLGCPTVVNNVETLATVPWIIEHGAAEYGKYGTENSKGTRLFCLSGWVNKPGTYEEEMGLPLKVLIEHYGGGMKNGSKLKAVIPGGSSTPPINAEEAYSVNLDYESMGKLGTFLGSGGIIVIPEEYPLIKILERIAEFYWDESCGQCTPCREGTGWLYKMVNTIMHGQGTQNEITDLKNTAKSMMGTTICALSDAAAMPILGFLNKFPAEFEAYLKEHSPTKERKLVTHASH